MSSKNNRFFKYPVLGCKSYMFTIDHSDRVDGHYSIFEVSLVIKYEFNVL